ncbi:hypothetical protein L6164_027118 [Bauhinia variegata]|uniref:Uncharacterized protein n=1 Tax=Bauhinia variegata TaxID=167791 RepID=A0ACB9LSC7_BAUVA|nr:hypothetical protein L6164_027118 [Bauhinia variegata]
MAAKRQREEETLVAEVVSEDFSKKHKPYNHILSLLEAEEEDPTQDLSPLITTLEQEITSSASDSETLLNSFQGNTTAATTAAATTIATLEDYSTSDSSAIIKEDDDKERVMRHLLEASDDELGIPNRSSGELGQDGFVMDFREDEVNNGTNSFASLCDGLWELEDETANYYTLLQSEFFL